MFRERSCGERVVIDRSIDNQTLLKTRSTKQIKCVMLLVQKYFNMVEAELSIFTKR